MPPSGVSFPKLFKGLLAVFIVQEEMYSFKFVFGSWQCCKLRTLVACGWCLPPSKPCLALLVLTAKPAGQLRSQASPPSGDRFCVQSQQRLLPSKSLGCGHLQGERTALDSASQKAFPRPNPAIFGFVASTARRSCS